MSDSPYQAPQTDSYELRLPPGADREGVYRVAKYQRWVIHALLANITVNVAYLALARVGLPLQLVLLVLWLAVVVFAIVSIFRLAAEVYGTAAAVLCAILMLFPCVSLMALLVVNQKATSYLQQHGVRVGFLGVNPSMIEALKPDRGA